MGGVERVGEGSSGGAGNIESGYLGGDGQEQAMFLDCVQSGQHPEKIVSSLVWLERVDRVERLLPRALHFFAFCGFIFFGRVANREVNPPSIGRIVPGIRAHELIREMVQRAAA